MRFKQSHLLERLANPERDAFLKIARRVRFERGATLFRQGERGSSFFVLESGSVRTFFTAADGSEFTIGFWSGGDLCGTADMIAERRALSAIAESVAKAFELTVRDLEKLVSACPAFSQELIKALSFKIRWTSMTAANLATKSVAERLAEIFRALAEIDGVPAGKGKVELNRRFSQEHLALMAGCSRQWVSHELAAMRERGALDTSRSGLWVVVPARLRPVAAEAAGSRFERANGVDRTSRQGLPRAFSRAGRDART